MLETLSNPPISEVVCGLIFDPNADLDPVLLGEYWGTKKADYPVRELKPPLINEEATTRSPQSGFPPVRVWFVSKGEDIVLQIQPDRFYLNWRRRNGTYPRFGDHGDESGILTRVLREFNAFSTFCSESTSTTPSPVRIELAKIDVLRQGEHWSDLEDLVEILPCLRDLAKFSQSGEANIALEVADSRKLGQLRVSIASGKQLLDDGRAGDRIVKLETRIEGPAIPDLAAGFRAANAELNKVFEAFIPAEQITKRFQNANLRSGQ